MRKNKMVQIGLAVFCSVIVSFFVFSFIDFSASGPAEDSSTEGNHQEGNAGDNNIKGDSGDQEDLTNDVQNNVNADETEVANDITNNVDGKNANITNSIDNNISDGNNNKIDNNVTNNIGVNVNVTVTNDVSNNVTGSESSPKGQDGEKDSDQNNGNSNGSNDGQNNGQNNEDEASNGGEVVWGVDSASLTTEEMLQCVTSNFGSPDIWGRYLGDKDGVSAGIKANEVELLHANGIKILVIWNHFNNATGYENGQNEARLAIQKAQSLGIPEGVAIFADIEPTYPVDSAFIRGWFETMNQSPYESGVYGVFDEGDSLFKAYQQAGQNNKELLKNNYVWTAHPSVGITTEANAPAYNPVAPENALIGGWQYGIEARACNIDTNLFDSDLLDVVW